MSKPSTAAIETLSSDPRAERFGYVCHRCLKCCHHKTIRVNPYEVARLAKKCGLTTTDFRRTYTERGEGVVLAQAEGGACVFLGSDGCTVHSDRPLVCRLYPLGRQLTPDGVESFYHTNLHPESGGELSRRGTIADFLITQDAHLFIEATDDYYAWFCTAYDLLSSMNGGDAPHSSPANLKVACDALDMDAAIAKYCVSNRTVEPTDVEARRKLHLRILYQHLEQRQEEHHEET